MRFWLIRLYGPKRRRVGSSYALDFTAWVMRLSSMAITDEGVTCSRRDCAEPAFRRLGNAKYCVKHYRFATMRTCAKRHGKTVPSYEELEMLIPLGLICQPCGRPMNWLAANGESTVLSLQHDRSGEYRFICRACNTRHAAHDGDEFYAIPSDQRRCPGCLHVKPLSAFCMDISRWLGRKTYCRGCASGRHKAWRTSRQRIIG